MPPKKQNGVNGETAINRTRKISKSDPNRPSYGDMIKAAISEHKNKKGSSREAILKYITETYNIPKASFSQTNVQVRHALKRGVESASFSQTNVQVRHALKRGVESGALKQVTGTGASGSFKLGNGSGPEEKKVRRAPKKKIATMSAGNSIPGEKKIVAMTAGRPKKMLAKMSAANKQPKATAVGSRTSTRTAKK
uniref:H15 domain-containing protein n=1 Tax=Panagrolaimus sp. PS1159 TaxID=55785 RepID=A0AC35FLI1_9BILA